NLLPCETDFISQDKRTALVSGSFKFDNNIKVTGYEIHFGRTKILENDLGVNNLFEIEGRGEGAAREDLSAAGTYLHGVLDNDEFRAYWLNKIRIARGFSARNFVDTRAIKDKAYNLLADSMRENLDMKFIFNLMGM
ncbi:MAG: cobyric acid synthase, partial [Synergistaceae bacterium]|nr:cobyric acid synthase [Synergistaceae bacterium]